LEEETVIKTTFDDLKKMGFPSVTDYCRSIVASFENTAGMKVEVYRGEMLCLIVNDVAEVAKLVPDDVGFRKYRPDKDLKAHRKVGKPRTEV
jgi:hypothetical protein